MGKDLPRLLEEKKASIAPPSISKSQEPWSLLWTHFRNFLYPARSRIYTIVVGVYPIISICE
jgi:hypothetical protein